MSWLYFDKQGQAIDMKAWARLMEGAEYKRVALTKLPNGTDVSTVWLGLNHSYGEGRPLIFETMTFGDEETQEQQRYSTEAEALAGHEAMVARLTKEGAH